MNPKQKTKKTNDEILNQITLKSIEKESLDKVFEALTALEQEASSDDDSTQKQYLKNIQNRANEKKMKIKLTSSNNSTQQNKKQSPTHDKFFKEDAHEAKDHKEEDENKLYKLKFSKKALRKAVRKLIDHFDKEEVNLMIWENDENLDGYIDYNEFEKMYKRCIMDEKEEEPKKLYYLVQFLMYDKEKRAYIIEEDTLEILYIRYGAKFEDAIVDIFA